MYLAEMVVLAAAVDTGRPPDPMAFPFRWTEWMRVELWDDPGAAGPLETGGSPADWLAGVRRRGITRMRLTVPGINAGGTLPDRHHFGFVGPAGESLRSAEADETWRVLSKIGNREAPDQRIWQVLLQGMSAPPGTFPQPPLPTPIPIAHDNLVSALRAVVAYAQRVGLEADEVARALEIGTAPAEPPPAAAAYQGDWLPHDWRTPATRHLVRTAFAANVFRGMGSWNDFGPLTPADAGEHERVSQALFVAMLDAVVAAVNGPP